MFSWELFNSLPIVAILRGFNREDALALVAACRSGGIVNFEVTMNTPGATEQISAIAEAHQGINLGAGTVCSLHDFQAAADAGASFVITPGVFPEVIRAVKERGMPIFPGAFTPTEIFQAWRLGADIVKVFPAGRLGPEYFRDIRGPFPEVKLMPTGGVTPQSIAEYRNAGAVAFSVGSQLFPKELVEAHRWKEITARAKEYESALRRE